MLAIVLVLLGICSRVIFHTPNFTPVIAIALFGGMYLKKEYALIVPVALMMISDMIIGFHSLVVVTWGSVALVALLGYAHRNRKNIRSTVFSSILGASIFFLFTNFGVWLTGYYSLTLGGLQNCFIMAVPFFRMSLLSTVVYMVLFTVLYERISISVKQTRLAPFLLS